MQDIIVHRFKEMKYLSVQGKTATGRLIEEKATREGNIYETPGRRMYNLFKFKILLKLKIYRNGMEPLDGES